MHTSRTTVVTPPGLSPVETLVDVLRARAGVGPLRCAITFLGDGETVTAELTYAELDARARAIGAELQRQGVSNEPVLVLFPPGPEYVAAFFGCLYAGAIAVPAYPPRLNRPDPRLRAIVTDTTARIALTSQSICARLERQFAQAPELAALRWIATDALTSTLVDAWHPADVSGNTLAFLQYTSGSTATPRGVMLTHANLLSNLAQIYQAFALTPEARGVIWLPPYHDMGLIGGILEPLYGGFPVTLLPPVAVLQRPLRWLRAISTCRATVSGGPNFAYDLCVSRIAPDEVAHLDLSQWTLAFTGAEPVRTETLNRFAATFAPCGFRREAFFPCYGLAEATLLVSGGRAGDGPRLLSVQREALTHGCAVASSPAAGDEWTLVSCGQSIPGQTIVIADPSTRQLLSSAQVGEIWISGPCVARGYWRRPAETTQTFDAAPVDQTARFLRSGDLGFLLNGELFVTGRLKDVLIVRGRNHYPQDLEYTAARSHPALSAVSAAFLVPAEDGEQVVIVQEIKRMERQLDIEELAACIRQAVAAEHGLQISEIVFIRPGTMPKTTSGKLQRSECRAAYGDGRLKVIGISALASGDDLITRAVPASVLSADRTDLAEVRQPADDVRRHLHEQVAQVLGLAVHQVDPGTALTSLGLDSLSASTLTGRIAKTLQVSVPIEQILEGWSLNELAHQVQARRSAGGYEPLGAFATAVDQRPPLIPATRSDLLHGPLSLEQERLWFLERRRPPNSSLHVPVAIRLCGQLYLDALEKSVNDVVRRHDALRMSFSTIQDRPSFLLSPDATLALRLRDLRDSPAADREPLARQLMTEEARRPFDLTVAPLLRGLVLQLAADDYIVVFTAHHLVADAISMILLVREVAECYRARSTGCSAHVPELPVQYADYAVWQRAWVQGPQLRSHVRYWKDRLAKPWLGWTWEQSLPQSTSRTFSGAYTAFNFAPPLIAAVRELSRGAGVTPFMTLLAAFGIALAHHARQEDVIIGFPVSGRIDPALESLIGLFAHPLLLRMDVTGDPSFRVVLAQVRHDTLEAYAHQDVPFAHLAAGTHRALGQGTDACRVLFSFVQHSLEELCLPELTLRALDVETDATDLDLTLTLLEEPSGLHARIVYATHTFSPDTISRLITTYLTLLDAVTRTPDLPVKHLLFSQPLPERADTASPASAQVVIAATFTAEPIADSLGFWLKRLHLGTDLQFAAYHQVFQELLSPVSLLARNQHGVNVLLVRLQDLHDTSAVDGAFAELEAMVRDLAQAIRASVARSGVPHVLCICHPSPRMLDDPQRQVVYRRLVAWLVDNLDDTAGVHVIPPEALDARYPVSSYDAPYAESMGRIPYSPLYFTALGTMVARYIYALRRPPVKVIVLDCDQVLWKGVLGEDGRSGIDIDVGCYALQTFMVEQHAAGRLICLCSKNHEQDVLEVFDHCPEMPLKREHLTAWRINWRPKSENLAALAAELQLDLESFVFLDDDPAEVAEVLAHCPSVLALQVPTTPEQIRPFLEHVWAFDCHDLTLVDQHRGVLYQQERERQRVRQRGMTLEDFIAALHVQVRIAPLQSGDLARVAQLTQRTNQFNCTTIRRTQAEVERLRLHGQAECLTVDVRDRFGEYGLVGVVIFIQEAGALCVDTLLLSCRALGRGVEYQMLARLGEIASERGLAYVHVPLVPSARNMPALNFLETVGAEYKEPEGDGWRFCFPAAVARTAAWVSSLPQDTEVATERTCT